MFEVRKGIFFSRTELPVFSRCIRNRPSRSWISASLKILIILAIAASPGCARFTAPSGPQPISKQEPAPPGNPSGESYYYYLISQRMLWERNLDAASLFLDKAIEKDPQSLFLKQGLMEVLVEKGHLEEALKESSSLLAQDPDNERTLLSRGAILLQLQRFDEAAAVYETVLKNTPEESAAYFLLGEAYQKAAKPENAMGVYARFLKAHPNDPDAASAWFLLGKIAFGQGDFALAAKAFEETLLLKPGNAQVRLNLAEAYRELGEDQKVEAIYKKMMEDTPSDSIAYIGLGQYYLQKKNIDKARETFNQARKIRQDPLLERSIAHAYLSYDFFAEAAEIFAALHQENPKDGETLYFWGYALENMGNQQEAMEVYRLIQPDSSYYAQALIYIAYMTKTPEDAQAALSALKATTSGDHLETDFAIHASNLHEQAGNHELAVEILNKRLAEEPENITILFNLGVLYDKQKQKEKCIETMKRVVELKPDHADALNFLGYTYADMGIHLQEAKKLIAKALEISPEDGYIMDSMGWVYFKLGQYEKALIYLEKAVKLAPDDPVIREHLGDAYANTGNPQAALEAYRISLPGKISRGDDTTDLEAKIRALEK